MNSNNNSNYINNLKLNLSNGQNSHYFINYLRDFWTRTNFFSLRTNLAVFDLFELNVKILCSSNAKAQRQRFEYPFFQLIKILLTQKYPINASFEFSHFNLLAIYCLKKSTSQFSLLKQNGNFSSSLYDTDVYDEMNIIEL